MFSLATAAALLTFGAPVTVNIEGIGSITCPDDAEPVDVVHKFARAAHAAGFAAVRSRDTLQSIVDTFCQQRTCTRPTVEESIALTIDGVGVITVLPWIEPADVVEELAVLSAKGGNALTATNLEEIMTHFCTRVLCDPARLVARLPLIDLSLTLEGIGRVEVPATAEPADLVERFAEEAEKAGVKFGRAEIDAAMGYFCARRPCARGVVTAAEADMLAGKSFDPITLSVEGYGTATVGSTQEPADVVEEFARAVLASGREFPDSAMVEMLEYFCARRICRRVTLFPGGVVEAVVASLANIGTATVNPADDPADVVENFAVQALAAGIEFGAAEMRQLMEFFCARRPCARLTVSPPAEV